ncbi:MAG: HNH endonuclease [Thermoanaerobaculia bacterium]
MLDETRIRLDAIQYVRAMRERWIAVPAAELKQFESGERPVFLRGQQGIFKPAELSEPLSITSTIDSPYNDHPQGSRILYDFLPDSREHDNQGLKRCADAELPLIYLLQVRRPPHPEYVVFAPVFVVGWDDTARRFLVDLSEQKPGTAVALAPLTRQLNLPTLPAPSSASEIRELTTSYETTAVQRRLYQARFRNEVLNAYRDRCAVCELRIRPLLDAAHVVPDRNPKTLILVHEGLALCATHHRAFEAGILRYDADYTIHIELPEKSSPGEGERTMLLAYEGKRLTLPSDERLWPLAQEVAGSW